MIRTFVVTISFALATGTAALAQLPPQPPPVSSPLGQGTEQERKDCQADVVKYCQAELTANENDVLGILSCLQHNRSKLSAACRGVLQKHGQ